MGRTKDMSRSIQRMDLGKGMEAMRRGEDGGEKLESLHPFFFPAGADVLALFGPDDLQFLHRNALPAGKAQGRLGWFALRIKGDAPGRPDGFDPSPLLRGRDSGRGEDEPPRRAHGLNFFEGDALGLKFLHQEALHLLQGPGDEPRGNFFGSYFQQQFRHFFLFGTQINADFANKKFFDS